MNNMLKNFSYFQCFILGCLLGVILFVATNKTEPTKKTSEIETNQVKIKSPCTITWFQHGSKSSNFISTSNTPWIMFGNDSSHTIVLNVDSNLFSTLTERYSDRVNTGRLDFYK